ncbi:unnamed protein product, partial [Symbiodinium sp. CCMP2456]
HLAALRSTSAQLRCLIRQDTKDYLHEVAVKATTDSTRDTVQRLRVLTGGPKRKQKGTTPLPAIETEQGILATTHQEAKQKWISHFSAIEDGQVKDPVEFVHDCYRRQQAKDLSDYTVAPADIPSLGELEAALRASSTDRAYGLDGIPGEVLHYGAPYLAKAVYQLLLKSAFRLCEPVQHKGGTLYFIWKHKGPKQCCSSYRGILVSSVLGKSLHKTLRNRCTTPLANSTVPLQVGGLPQYPVTIPAHAARLFQSGCQARKCSHALLFLDLQEAFYRIIRPLVTGDHPTDTEVARICAAVQLPSNTVHELRDFIGGPSLLREAGSSEWAEGAISESLHDTWFRLPDEPEVIVTRTGSRPGDSLSDLVFSFLFAKVLQQVRQALIQAELLAYIPWNQSMQCSIQVESTHPERTIGLSDATWMDDLSMFLMSPDAPSLIAALNFGASSLIDACLQRALVPNLSRGKTEAIVQLHSKGAKATRRRIFGDEEGTIPLSCRLWKEAKLRIVPVYRHLGGFLQHNGGLRHEIAYRCSQAWEAFNRRRRKVFQSPLVSATDKAALFDSLISTVMFHGSGTWTRVAQAHIDTLDAVLRQMACQMLTPKYSCEEAWHLGLSHAIALAGIPRAATYLHAFRLRYLLSCIRLDVPEIWALAHWEQDWLRLVRTSVEWLWEHTRMVDDKRSWTLLWDAWVLECRSSPRKWKSRVRRAIAHALFVERGQVPIAHGAASNGVEFCAPCQIIFQVLDCLFHLDFDGQASTVGDAEFWERLRLSFSSVCLPRARIRLTLTAWEDGIRQGNYTYTNAVRDRIDSAVEWLRSADLVDWLIWEPRAQKTKGDVFRQSSASLSSLVLHTVHLPAPAQWTQDHALIVVGDAADSPAAQGLLKSSLNFPHSESLLRLEQGLDLDFLTTQDAECGFCLSTIGLRQASDIARCPASSRVRDSLSLRLALEIALADIRTAERGGCVTLFDEEPAKPAETLSKENKPVDQEPAKPAETLPKENKPVNEEPAKPAETPPKENKPVKEEPQKETKVTPSKVTSTKRIEPSSPKSVKEEPVTGRSAEAAHTTPAQVFLSAKEDWMKSSIMMNISSKKRGKRTGLYVWKKYAELMKEHGEAVAADLATSKKKADPSGSGKWWKKHPDRPEAQDWELFKVFDGKTEVSESEDEVAFELSGGAELDEGMTHGAMRLAHEDTLSQILGGTGSSGSTENPREKDDIPKPKTPKTVKQAAEALFKKVTLKLSEAESIETMLKKGGMCLGCKLALNLEPQNIIKLHPHEPKLLFTINAKTLNPNPRTNPNHGPNSSEAQPLNPNGLWFRVQVWE